MTRNVAIISYGTGNLASLSDALEEVGATCTVAKTPRDLADVDALVLPGVGHFGHAMNHFRSSGLLVPTLEKIRSGVPTLGICLGFQLLTRSSEEAGRAPGLGLLPPSLLFAFGLLNRKCTRYPTWVGIPLSVRKARRAC